MFDRETSFRLLIYGDQSVRIMLLIIDYGFVYFLDIPLVDLKKLPSGELRARLLPLLNVSRSDGNLFARFSTYIESTQVINELFRGVCVRMHTESPLMQA